MVGTSQETAQMRGVAITVIVEIVALASLVIAADSQEMIDLRRLMHAYMVSPLVSLYFDLRHS